MARIARDFNVEYTMIHKAGGMEEIIKFKPRRQSCIRRFESREFQWTEWAF